MTDSGRRVGRPGIWGPDRMLPRRLLIRGTLPSRIMVLLGPAAGSGIICSVVLSGRDPARSDLRCSPCPPCPISTSIVVVSLNGGFIRRRPSYRATCLSRSAAMRPEGGLSARPGKAYGKA